MLVGLAVLAGVAIRVTHPSGKETEINAPVGSRVAIDKEGNVQVALPPEKPTGPAKATGPSPLDRLDPKHIPAAERFPWQPKE